MKLESLDLRLLKKTQKKTQWGNLKTEVHQNYDKLFHTQCCHYNVNILQCTDKYETNEVHVSVILFLSGDCYNTIQHLEEAWFHLKCYALPTSKLFWLQLDKSKQSFSLLKAFILMPNFHRVKCKKTLPNRVIRQETLPHKNELNYSKISSV